MAMQSIDLSPLSILNRMKKIENAIPRKDFDVYTAQSFPNSGNITNEDLQKEAKFMLEFCGLKGYETDILFAKTEQGVGGYITSSSNIYERAVHIKVSDEYIGYPERCLAVLAHEICHKVIDVNGLHDTDTDENETLTDLATIYMGLGEIILRGYKSHTHILGYLDFNNYRVAHHIMCVVYGHVESEKTGLAESDVLLDDVINYWERAGSERSILKECFVALEKQHSAFWKNLNLLTELINRFKIDMLHNYMHYDSIFYKNLQDDNGNFKRKLAAFSILYELIASDSYPEAKTNAAIEGLNNIVEDSIYDLFTFYQQRNVIDFKYDIECPNCRTISKNNQKVMGRKAVLKCGKCGCHYLYDAEIWNCTIKAKERREAKMREEELINQKVNYRINKAQEEADRIINEARNAHLQLERERKMIEEQARINYREDIIDKAPSMLKWLIKRYL